MGTLDLSGGTFNATLGDVVIGRIGSGAGYGRGTLTMDDGIVTANSITLADPGSGTNPTNTTGTLTV